jgi:hypothetical protein
MAATGDWPALVPAPTADVIEACGGVVRVADLDAGKNHRLHTDKNQKNPEGAK